MDTIYLFGKREKVKIAPFVPIIDVYANELCSIIENAEGRVLQD